MVPIAPKSDTSSTCCTIGRSGTSCISSTNGTLPVYFEAFLQGASEKTPVRAFIDFSFEHGVCFPLTILFENEKKRYSLLRKIFKNISQNFYFVNSMLKMFLDIAFSIDNL